MFNLKNLLIFGTGFIVARFIYVKGLTQKENQIIDAVKHNVSDFLDRNFPDVPVEEKIQAVNQMMTVSEKSNFGGCGCGCGGGCGDKPLMSPDTTGEIIMDRF